MPVTQIIESDRGNTYIMTVDGLDVAEVDILKLDDDRRIVFYRPVAKAHSWGEVSKDDERTDEELAKDTFFLKKVSMKAPSFRRKSL